MKVYLLAKRSLLLVPGSTKTIELPGDLDNLGTDAKDYVKRLREIADQIEKYVKDEEPVVVAKVNK